MLTISDFLRFYPKLTLPTIEVRAHMPLLPPTDLRRVSASTFRIGKHLNAMQFTEVRFRNNGQLSLAGIIRRLRMLNLALSLQIVFKLSRCPPPTNPRTTTTWHRSRWWTR